MNLLHSVRNAMSLNSIALIISVLAPELCFAKQDQSAFTPVASGSGLMTKSSSVASGMSMRTKSNPRDQWNILGSHPIVSLRKNQSDVEFDLGMGNWFLDTESKYAEVATDSSPMHVGMGTTIVTATGIRFGVHAEIGDHPLKVKVKKPVALSTRVKQSLQDISLFAAAGITEQIGFSMNLIMADRKVAGESETGTVFSPAIMGMFETAEVIFDMIQAHEDLGIFGHWRLNLIHEYASARYLTAEMTRVLPNSGDDFWRFAVGGRQRISSHGSMGGEILYQQAYTNDAGQCVRPALIGARGDIDKEISANQIISFGAHFDAGKCAYSDVETQAGSIQFKGGFAVLF